MSAVRPADLASCPLMAQLTPQELEAAATAFRTRRFPKGAILVAEGDRLDTFNIVLSGRVKFFWRDENDRQVDAAIVGPGEDFAAQALGGPMLNTAIALEDVRVACLPLAEFEALLLGHPRLALAYVKRVVELFRRNVAYRRSFAMDSVYRRIVTLFGAAARQAGDARVIAERLTHAEIGQRVGATREMVGRILRDLARGGYVEVDRGRITILRDLPPEW